MDLKITVKKPTFEGIKTGRIREIKRPWSPYWRRRLEGVRYERILVECGGNRLIFPWSGVRQDPIVIGKRSVWGFIILLFRP